MNKEWIKQILSGEKKLLKLTQIKPVNAGNFPEVSVKNLFKEFSIRPEIVPYMPPITTKKMKQLDRKYFFTVVNSFFPEEIYDIIHHASSQRNAIKEVEEKRESIMMSQEMAKEMFRFPYVSVSNLLSLLTCSIV